MPQISYSLEAAKYYTSTDGTTEVYFDDEKGNLRDFSRCADISAQLVVTSLSGAPTNVIITIETSAYNSTVAADWSTVVTFTTVTAATSEVKSSTSGVGVMTYLRAVYAWTG
jgi:hypothetical protein